MAKSRYRVEPGLPAASESRPADAPSPPPEPPPAKESCRSCRHWLPLADPNLGFCRRYPPSVPSLILSASGPVRMFPVTLAEDLCGERAPRA